MSNELICVSVPGATHRLILLHGWGADADDLVPLGQKLINKVVNRKVELVSFRAPQSHSGGYGRQWYGLFPPDWEAVPFAIKDLQIRIEAICKNSIPIEKTAILGFSQGGAMAISTGSDLPLAGLIGCSAYPHPGWLPSKTCPPTLLLHGRQDEIVPFDAAKKIFGFLQKNNIDSQLCLFDGGHEIPEEFYETIEICLKKWFI